MSRKPEQGLWDRFRRNVGDSDLFLLQRIENIVVDGMPDVVCQSYPQPRTFHGHTTFIELKCAPKMPIRPGTQLLTESNGLRQDQKNWLLEWTRYGGRSMVLIGVKDDPNFHLAIPGKHHDLINGAAIKELINLDGAISSHGTSFWLDLKAAL